MHLTRLLLNPRSPGVRRDLANVYNMHRRVLSGFRDEGADAARARHKVLFRLEAEPGKPLALLVQSADLPDWQRLPPGYLLESFDANPAIRDLGPLLSAIDVGRSFRFRLRANPTKRLRTGTKTPGKRVELRGYEALSKWFERKANDAGFELVRAASLDNGQGSSSWNGSLSVREESKASGIRDGAQMRFGSALFEGQLRVLDPEALRLAIRDGMGAAKSYGFGLLSIAPAVP